MVACMALTTVVFALCFEYPAWAVVPFMIVGGIVMQPVQGVVYTVAPETAVSPRHVGVAIGITTLATNVGGISVAIAGSVIDAAGFHALTLMLIAIGAVGLIAGIVLLIWARRR